MSDDLDPERMSQWRYVTGATSRLRAALGVKGAYSWLRTYNRELGATPLELIQTGRGGQVLEEAERLANGDSQ
jgi:hypothetical protein